MELFVLFGCNAYAAPDLLGVYSSQGAAEAAWDVHIESDEAEPYDSHLVRSVRVDAPAAVHFLFD